MADLWNMRSEKHTSLREKAQIAAEKWLTAAWSKRSAFDLYSALYSIWPPCGEQLGPVKE